MTFYSYAGGSSRFTRLAVRPLATTAFVLGIFGLNSAHAQKAPVKNTTDYYGVYMQDSKIGSSVMSRDEKAMYKGKPAVRADATMNIDLKVMGASSKISSVSMTYMNPKTGAPFYSESTSTAAGRVTATKTTYTDHSVSYEANIMGSQQKGTLTLKPGETFLVDPSDAGMSGPPKIGTKLKGKMFVPDLMKLVDADIEVVGKETVTIGGLAVTAYKIIEHSIATSTIYVNEAGDLLRLDVPPGMQFRKEPKAIALAPSSAVGPDLIALTGIRPTGESLGKARTAQTIRYELSGVSSKFAPNDTVQTVTQDVSTQAYTVTVTPHALPDGPTVPLFAKPADAPEALRPFLQSTIYVPANDPEFIALAKQVVGTETDSAKAAAKIAHYVHNTVKPDPGIAAFRTAKDVLRDPRGVCRDYTALFTAIARAAGLPTKQCVGVGYAGEKNGGLFIGHAWPEVWVGNNTWVALEPTWGLPFADATHIKLAEGEIADSLEAAAALSTTKIKVVTVE